MVPGNRDALLSILDIELLNILQINCNTIGTGKGEKGTKTAKTKRTQPMWEVNSDVQTLAWKRIVLRKTMMQTPVQTQAAV